MLEFRMNFKQVMKMTQSTPQRVVRRGRVFPEIQWTDEQKESLSKKKKGKTLIETVGEERAKEVKEKMSQSQKGRKHSEESKKKFVKLTLVKVILHMERVINKLVIRTLIIINPCLPENQF